MSYIARLHVFVHTEAAAVGDDAEGDLAAGFREIKAADRGFEPTEILSGARNCPG
ncbi:MAG: hypothetical protein O7A66_13165 [Alphaproteobacteria bacterium]|nr:hypothetical protein [Alphaproteobacteria bacterium]